MYYHRSDCFHVVAAAMRRAGRAGDFCEYGCGVAPITAWLRPRFAGWRYTLVDLPSPMLDFARWRFRRFANVEAREPGLGADLPLTRDYDAIACLEVLEHVINPLEVVRHLVAHLKPGGALFVNFVDEPGGDENLLESAAQRGETIEYLNRELRAVAPLHVNGPDVVHGRLADAAYEAERLARLERALDRPVRGLRLLNLGCGTGGFNAAAEAAGALAWGVDVDPDAVAIAGARVGAGRILRAAAESLPFPA